MSASFKGPLLANPDSMAGALKGAPIDLFGNTQWVTYFNDFTDNDNDYVVTTAWSPTVFTAGTQAISAVYDDSGIGILTLDGGAGANQGVVTQLDGSAAAGRATFGYTPIANGAAIFASRFRIKDVTNSAIFVGLAELHATSNVLLTNAQTVTASDNHIGFHQISTDAGALRFTTAGTAIANLVTDTSILGTALADDGWIEVACRIDGTSGYSGFVRVPGQSTNWTKVASGSGTAFNEQMVISLGVLGAAGGDDLDVDYVMLATKRDVAA